jgi:hypothetical protein
MAVLRGLLLGLGVVVTLLSVIWIFQGLGLLQWPSESFMLGDRKWAINGGISAVVGLFLMWLGRPR